MMNTFNPFRNIAGLLLILAFAAACTKDSTSPNSNSISGGTDYHRVTGADTLWITDSIWTNQGGDYFSNLQPLTDNKVILSLFVELDGKSYLIQSGNSLPYRSGQLSFSGTTLSFVAPYHQLPFRSLNLMIITNN